MQRAITTADPKFFKLFAKFYPFHIAQLSNQTHRLHFVGSSLTLVCIAMMITSGRPRYLL